jgi:lysyl-tRNA synthetase class 2
MRRGLDIRKATAAFERAARKAVHGTREDRSGRVISSVLANVTYDRRTRALEVRFVTGRTYRYADVPADLYERLLKAESKGRFFNSHIRDRYPAHELRR